MRIGSHLFAAMASFAAFCAPSQLSAETVAFVVVDHDSASVRYELWRNQLSRTEIEVDLRLQEPNTGIRAMCCRGIARGGELQVSDDLAYLLGRIKKVELNSVRSKDCNNEPVKTSRRTMIRALRDVRPASDGVERSNSVSNIINQTLISYALAAVCESSHNSSRSVSDQLNFEAALEVAQCGREWLHQYKDEGVARARSIESCREIMRGS